MSILHGKQYAGVAALAIIKPHNASAASSGTRSGNAPRALPDVNLKRVFINFRIRFFQGRVVHSATRAVKRRFSR
jgi:hypothetical protein